ncbi:hypothetical protein DAEQUDRAFT_674262 [Daedalea quercina L-15889]|uniref:Uncharacterized protein n=1 Tax=Daedalea quercina L-15889 TaxID=1314783 RepID=A0A165NDW1_9APHY|nr:hypothetical protein DAEQUDRAFT_674262 [Daedalea quercina L-15889]
MMKTDILFSSPRIRFSRSQQEAILAWGKELGAKDVPSLYALDKFQKEALDTLGNPTVKMTSASGNVWYQNSIGDGLRMVRVNVSEYFVPI